MTHRFSVGTAFSRGWDAFAKRPGFFIGVLVLLFCIGIALQVPSIVVDLLVPDRIEEGEAALAVASLFGLWFGLLFGIVSWVAQQYLSVGSAQLSLEAVFGRKYELKSLIVEPKVFLNALLAMVLGGILVAIGFLLLIIPGIYLSLAFAPLVYVVLDQKTGPVEALQRAWNLTAGNRGRLFLFALATVGVNLLGVLALGVGLLVTVPFTWLATADVYRQLKG